MTIVLCNKCSLPFALPPFSQMCAQAVSAAHMFASAKASLGVANDWVSLEFLQVIINVLPTRLYHARYLIPRLANPPGS
jgi:hypothetical protein